MAKWEGASRGNLLGYKIFVFSVRKIGLNFSYFLLIFVALYYFLFAWKSNKTTYYYFRKRLEFSAFKSVIGLYKSYYVFGQTLIDRILISSGKRDRFTYEFDGIENIKEAYKNQEGAIMISAHIGNFEVSEYFFEDIGENFVTNIVTTDLERQKIKEYIEKLSIKSNMKYLLIKEDMSHIFTFKNALDNNEFICMTGDRYMEKAKFIEKEFLGEKAKFPRGPFLLSSRFKVPVLFVYVLKDSATHYHLYARKAEFKARDEEGLLENYLEITEKLVRKYPYQWFNYFDFWS